MKIIRKHQWNSNTTTLLHCIYCSHHDNIIVMSLKRKKQKTSHTDNKKNDNQSDDLHQSTDQPDILHPR